MKRREFLQGSMAAAGFMILGAQTAHSYAANSAVRWALLGCGKRGTSVANSFVKNTDAHLVALADIFPDQLEKAHAHFDALNASVGKPVIDPKLLFRGYKAAEELAASNAVDAIQISTPPWFHIDHLETVVSAGKHAYCEKPVGVDVTQSRRALEIAKRYDGKVSMDVGFQVRSAPPFAEIVRRIHEGAIGKIASINAHYNAPEATYPDMPGKSADELRLRRWLWDKHLSGDILLEQNIHVIDVCNWIVGAHPIKAIAKSSRKVLKNAGNISDNYEVIFTYPDEIEMSFSSTQFSGGGYFDVAERIFGSAGLAEAPYSGPLHILGENPWAWSDPAHQKAPAQFAADGAFTDNLALADATKDRTFIESITSGHFHNQIPQGVESALSCMLARHAAELGREVTWNELAQFTETFPLGMNISQFR
jgi:myo-inositol 2-dehydrogenase / D-chiro-inositol 1-dehydrogenase